MKTPTFITKIVDLIFPPKELTAEEVITGLGKTRDEINQVIGDMNQKILNEKEQRVVNDLTSTVVTLIDVRDNINKMISFLETFVEKTVVKTDVSSVNLPLQYRVMSTINP